jgi:hypothetical protein
VHALHDHDEGAGPQVVQARRDGLVPPTERGCPFRRALDLADMVRVVDNDDVAALAGQRAADGGRETRAALVGLEADLGVLVAGQAEARSPGPPVGLALDQAPALDAVALRL